jgi:signal transduction histidine kinase
MKDSGTLLNLFKNRHDRRVIIITFLAVCLVTISVFYFVLSLGRPFLGFDLVYQDGVWKVGAIDTNGLASQSGVKIGDKPLEIDDQPAGVFLEKYEKAGTVYSFLFTKISLTDEQGNVTTVVLERFFPYTRIMVSQISTFIVCLVFWITGLYVFYKRPRNQAALILCLCSLMVGVLFCSNMAGELGIFHAGVLSIVASITGPWLMLHFFLVLPEERTWVRGNPLVYLIYLPPLITLILLPVWGYADRQPLADFRIFRFLEIGTGLFLVGGTVILNYLRAGSVRTQQQMIIVLIGCLAALIPFLAFFLLPELIANSVVIPPGYTVLFLVFIPISMGVAVVTQKLMDIDFVIRRGVIYALISIVMAAILSVALFPVLAFQNSLGVFQQVIICLVLGGAATALFGPTKQGIELFIDRLFYKDRYDYRQTIHSFSTSLNTLREATDISRLIVGTAVQTLNLAGGCLFLKSQAGFFEVSAAQGIFTEVDRQKKLAGLISQRSKLIEFPHSTSSVNPEVAYLMPLLGGGKEIGILFLSHKVSRQDFSSDDIFLLQGLVSVVSTALHSALLVRDVSLRNTFISIASHELRTPLTSIMGYAELMLLRNPSEESRRKWLTKIVSNGQKITAMVDDLLNVTRIQSGKISLKLEGVKLDEYLNERLAVAQESDNKHTFETNIEPGLPEAFVDRDKFGQVAGNLLSNAVKFSPNGGRITLSARHDAAHHRIVVSVSDEGMGIGPDDRKSLFTTFHRIQRPETQGIRGSGLGLYIVKEWTEAMGGEIWLESELNKGSTFYVSIPAVDTHQTD